MSTHRGSEWVVRPLLVARVSIVASLCPAAHGVSRRVCGLVVVVVEEMVVVGGCGGGGGDGGGGGGDAGGGGDGGVGLVVVHPPGRAGWLSMSTSEESGQNACRVMGYGLG